MSKIKFNQIHEDVVEITISPDTPVEVVEQLTKSLVNRGLVEDTKNSTLSIRYFYKPEDSANSVADKLIKSLKSLAKQDDPNEYWKPKNQMAHQKKLREQAIAERRAKLGIKPSATSNVSNKPAPNAAPAGTKAIPHDAEWTAGGSGRRYAYINDPVTKMEKLEYHEESCECGKCESVEKSGYGPKGGGQYSAADNARRKMVNTGEQTGFGRNVNTKRYTTAKYGNSTPQTDPKLKRPQPVKTFTPEQIAEENKKRGLIKAWADHLPFPNAEEEMARIAAAQRAQNGDDAMANQLAQMMHSKAMLGGHRQPTSEDMIMAGEQMGFGTSEKVTKSQDQQWNGAINNWLAEATKPISQRFASEEEEIAYWSNIKVADRDDGSSGY